MVANNPTANPILNLIINTTVFYNIKIDPEGTANSFDIRHSTFDIGHSSPPYSHTPTPIIGGCA